MTMMMTRAVGGAASVLPLVTDLVKRLDGAARVGIVLRPNALELQACLSALEARLQNGDQSHRINAPARVIEVVRTDLMLVRDAIELLLARKRKRERVLLVGNARARDRQARFALDLVMECARRLGIDDAITADEPNAGTSLRSGKTTEGPLLRQKKQQLAAGRPLETFRMPIAPENGELGFEVDNADDDDADTAVKMDGITSETDSMNRWLRSATSSRSGSQPEVHGDEEAGKQFTAAQAKYASARQLERAGGDPNEVARLYEQAAATGHTGATVRLALILQRKGEIARSTELFTQTAKAGHAGGQYHLALAVAPHDGGRAAELYMQAACAGHKGAMVNLGTAFRTGNGVERSVIRAIVLYRRAAAQGSRRARVRLAACYAGGEGVRRDSALAAQLYEEAAEKGCLVARCALARCYFDGDGVPCDDDRAVALFRDVVEGPASPACARALVALAECYRDGRGVKKDPVHAAAILKQAQAQERADAEAHGNVSDMDFVSDSDFDSDSDSDSDSVVATEPYAEACAHLKALTEANADASISADLM